MARSKSSTSRSQLGRKRVLLANPRGFCAGVTRAIDAVERALASFGKVYVRRAIVHNAGVIARLERMGAVFVNETDEVPHGSIVILSAHGVAKTVVHDARSSGLRVVDATCPLVAKVHSHVIKQHEQGRHIILVGHEGHPETIGTMGQVPTESVSLVSDVASLGALGFDRATKVAYAVQTTFSVSEARLVVEAIEARFDDVVGPRTSSICYATTNRQSAIAKIAERAGYVIVVGDLMSSNARRLVEVASGAGRGRAVLVASPDQLDWPSIDAASTIGMTAAASTPADAVENICEALATRGFAISEFDGVDEAARFKPVMLGTA